MVRHGGQRRVVAELGCSVTVLSAARLLRSATYNQLSMSPRCLPSLAQLSEMEISSRRPEFSRVLYQTVTRHIIR